MRRVLAVLAVGLWLLSTALGGLSRASAASFGPAAIESVSPDAQFDVADSPVVSADGRFVAFRGTVDGQTGLWRRDLVTGALDPIALDPADAPYATGVQAPSISADGRFVAFDATTPLDPVNDTNGAWDVYVRDMTVAAGAPGADTLASAVNGASAGLTYAANDPSVDGARIAGAQTGSPVSPSTPTSPGGAITADGRTVVFSINTQSNLADPTSTATATPAGQVAVRNLDTRTTTLVSVDKTTGGPVSFFDFLTLSDLGAVANDDAVISADGSTVAWLSPLGAIARESAYLQGEAELLGATDNLNDPNQDPQAVWRRIADGPAAPTLRVSGFVDPYAPSCPPTSDVTTGVPAGCAGPLDYHVLGSPGGAAFATTGGLSFSHLAMSGDGYAVVLLSPAPLLGIQNGGYSEAYLVNMHPGLTRDQATRALTQAAQTSGASAAGESPLNGDAISGDGTTVLLSTQRTRFDLTSPRYIGPIRTAAAAADEVYVVDLRSDTLDLLTRGFDGSPSDFPDACRFGAYSPSVSGDGTQVAFDSCADNLVFGDGNSASDVFAAGQLTPISSTAPAQSPALLPAPALAPSEMLTVTVKPLRAFIEVQAIVPGAGRLAAVASWAERIASRRGVRRARTVDHTVATASSTPSQAGLALLRLSPERRYLTAAQRAGGLPLTVAVTLQLPGSAAPLSRTVKLSFIEKAARRAQPRHRSHTHHRSHARQLSHAHHRRHRAARHHRPASRHR